MNQIHELPTWLIDKLKTDLPPEKIIEGLRNEIRKFDDCFGVTYSSDNLLFMTTYVDMDLFLSSDSKANECLKTIYLDYMDCLDLLELELKEAKKWQN